MITDARQIPSGTTIQCELCVVGAGAAGITVARAFCGTDVEVCLLEAGGLAPDQDTQALYAGENVGLPYYPLDETRFRSFGGSTNRWAGWCRPLDSGDFHARSWVPYSGWPFERATLEPYYARAQAICEIDAFEYNPQHWQSAIPELYRLPVNRELVHTAVWQGSPPTKFGVVYRRELERAQNVSTYLHANVVELITNEVGRVVVRARVATLSGGQFDVRARVFVLAAGGIETARLLLVSDAVHRGGLGNRHGNVGRFFMEHPHLVAGRIKLSRSSPRPRITALDRGIAGVWARLALRRPSKNIKCAFTISEAAQERHRILNYSSQLIPVATSSRLQSGPHRSFNIILSNMRSLRRIGWMIRHRRMPDGTLSHLANVLTHPAFVARGIYDEVFRRPTEMRIHTQCEQAPNLASRVSLSQDRDALGVRRVRLDWRLSTLDKHTIRTAQQIIGDELERLGVGHVEHDEWLLADDDSWGPALSGGHHHMGTARMSSDPKTGVVDAHGRVHDVQNVYVADSSVFPTGGFANPLLTIAALALRCADHLRQALRAGD